jgi:hypothetical protein
MNLKGHESFRHESLRHEERLMIKEYEQDIHGPTDDISSSASSLKLSRETFVV